MKKKPAPTGEEEDQVMPADRGEVMSQGPGDTKDVLNALQQFNSDRDFILVTCDVQSLYTCISHEAGLEALQHYLNTRSDTLPPNEFLLTLKKLFLSKNYFQ